jgi:hypothetical protein
MTIESALFNESEIPVVLLPGGVNIRFMPLYGDVSLNGEVHTFDAALILQYLVDKIDLNEQQQINADVTLDTTISSLDASIILQYVVGIVDSLPYDTSREPLAASGIIEMNDKFVHPGEKIEIPLYLSEGENILSFEGLVEYNSQHLLFDNILWSSFLDSFSIEINHSDGKIKTAGAGSLPDGRDGIFATLQFTVNQSFGDETIVTLETLRWNEEPPMANVASAKLSHVSVAGDMQNQNPDEFRLEQNYPNPFNSNTLIAYQVPRATRVNISIYSLSGQLVQTLVNDFKNAGVHSVEWNATDLSSGLYWYKITADQFMAVRKCIILK